MVNRNNARRRAKRRRVNSSSSVQNQLMPRKLVLILDDSWLEALKHLTCRQWSKMSLVCHQINGIVQRNMSRLPRQVIGSITMDTQYLSCNPRTTPIARSLKELFHPASYTKKVTMRTVPQKLIDANFKGEDRYIRCQNFKLLPYSNKPSTIQKIAQSLEWLVKNVRSDSITFPEWMFNRIHENVEIRALLTNFIFDASQKCKAQEFVFTFVHVTFPNVKLVDILIEDFFALPGIKGNISRVVINCNLDYAQYRSKFGENLIDLEVDSRADALYEIENGEKRVRISLFRGYTFDKAFRKTQCSNCTVTSPSPRSKKSSIVINCDLDYRQYRSKFGEYLIDLEVDSRADALYEIENGEKRVRISLFLGGWNYHGRSELKFYTI